MGFTGYLYGLATDRINGPVAAALKCALWLLSVLYGLAVSVAIAMYSLKPGRAGCTVISVGNITPGGTGKTVLVQAIALFLKERGHTVAILTRGYKKQKPARGQDCADYRAMGDEACMMAKKLDGIPVIVDADRVRSAAKAVREFQADTVVLDDGFQQWRVHKDLEIVTLDAHNPFGNGHLIPRGILRQPLQSLAKAAIFVLTGAASARQSDNTRAFLAKVNPAALVVHARHVLKNIYRLGAPENTVAADFLKNKSVTLFCGIGNPGSFRGLAAEAGAQVKHEMIFADHHPYTEENIEEAFKRSRDAGCATLLTTEKDAVRIPLAARKRFGHDILVVAAELKIEDEEKRFFDRLLSVYPA